MIIYEAFAGQVGSSISFVLVLQGDRETFAATGGDGMWQRSRAGLGDRPSVSACWAHDETRYRAYTLQAEEMWEIAIP